MVDSIAKEYPTSDADLAEDEALQLPDEVVTQSRLAVLDLPLRAGCGRAP